MGKVKNFFVALGKWFNLKDRPKRILIIALCLVLAGGLLGSMVQTDFYRYRVYSETIETVPVSSKGEALYEETGVKSWSTADIYQPKSASAEDPVPLVFVVPGIQRTKETQASFCIELVRRGYAGHLHRPVRAGGIFFLVRGAVRHAGRVRALFLDGLSV